MGSYYHIMKGQKAWRDVLPPTKRQTRPKRAPSLSPEEMRQLTANVLRRITRRRGCGVLMSVLAQHESEEGRARISGVVRRLREDQKICAHTRTEWLTGLEDDNTERYRFHDERNLIYVARASCPACKRLRKQMAEKLRRDQQLVLHYLKQYPNAATSKIVKDINYFHGDPYLHLTELRTREVIRSLHEEGLIRSDYEDAPKEPPKAGTRVVHKSYGEGVVVEPPGGLDKQDCFFARFPNSIKTAVRRFAWPNRGHSLQVFLTESVESAP